MDVDSAELDRRIAQSAHWIAQADGLLICAGAGMGVDSGLPDFRGTQGFWRAYPALAQSRIRFEQIASPAAFRAEPRLAWGFYGHRLNLYRRTVPHEGFAILRSIAAHLRHGCAVFTSNVDGQFQRAGFEAGLVAECHGSIHWLQCAEPCCASIWPADGLAPDVDDARCILLSDLPLCPECGALARPNILMFGDAQWLAARSEAQMRGVERWIARAGRPVAIELGAGTAIPTVRWFAEQSPGQLIRINPTDARVGSGRGVGIACGALEGLRAIGQRLAELGYFDGGDDSGKPRTAV